MCIQCIGMCSYCDCRNLPILSRLSCEHADLLKAAAALVEAYTLDAPESERQRLFDDLLHRVDQHGREEDRVLFGALREDPEFTDAIDHLCAEHGRLYRSFRLLRRDGATLGEVTEAVERLRRHIIAEEHGLFPPAAVLFGPAALAHAEHRAAETHGNPPTSDSHVPHRETAHDGELLLR